MPPIMQVIASAGPFSSSYTYTGYALNNSSGGGAADGGSYAQAGGNNGQGDVGGTATFNVGIPYTTLRVLYGNMANGQLGNSASGAVLSINGSNVSATGTYNQDGYNPVTLSIMMLLMELWAQLEFKQAVSGSFGSAIYAIIIDSSKLLATGPEY